MSTWDLLAGLPVEIEGYALEGRELAFSDEFTRYTTLIRLHGGGEEGVGEDVVYDGLDHAAFPGRRSGAAARRLLDARLVLASCLADLDTFPDPPVRDVSRRYRRWAFESAALDLALRQAERSLPASSRARAAAAHLRRLDAPGRIRQRGARDLRAHDARARALSGHPLQARPDQHLDATS